MTVRAETSKSGKTRGVPLHATLVTTLRTMPQGKGEEPVFRVGKCSVLARFLRDLKVAGIVNTDRSLDLHALRGTCATWLLRSGAPISAVQKLLGHATVTMTLTRYAKMTEHDVRSAVGRITFPGECDRSAENTPEKAAT